MTGRRGLRSLAALALSLTCATPAVLLAGCGGVPRQTTPTHDVIAGPLLLTALGVAGANLTAHGRAPSAIPDAEIKSAIDAAATAVSVAGSGALRLVSVRVVRLAGNALASVTMTESTSKSQAVGCLKLVAGARHQVSAGPCTG